MEREILDKINEAFDKAMEKFQNDPDVIYPTEKDRLKLKYSDQGKLKEWKKNKNCIYDKCPNKSIAKSHTIQKSTSIKLISEDSHVLTPKFNDKTGVVELISQGIGEASTFPGFCEDHEKLFEEFENKKDLSTEDHFVLQLYRTICREVVIAEHNHEVLSTNLKKYIQYRNEKIKEFFLVELGPEFIKQHNIKTKKVNLTRGDYRQTQVEKGLADLKDYLKSLKDLKNAITNDVNKKKFQQTMCKAIEINDKGKG